MRHGHGLRKLNRTTSHRLAMLRNMMNSLIEHEVIKTTVPKAKELRRVVEPMITLAKEATVANRRLASVPGTPSTMVPAAALASEALAPVMVAAEPSVPSAEYCSVDAVAPLAVMHTAPMDTIWMGPPRTVKMVVPLTSTAATAW